ncbi:HEAT repeat domain-containing protein [Pseudomonas sp. MTM4]|uniref:HEAT repeat domain-containing protein n=1 Tax=unclassified Pseudomonas TaxID=196821 RepID=UPI0018D24710|nr:MULTISPECIES: HEAT repeat domain-containing protein [unclassified Pseudomonas]MBC8650125.1 HEAT repeat domain-containing protein [Pseudomonas sp. MT4]QXY92448.1 HEAT repeat domain-containing protein [Pseudomonas sp. MTM4]
MLFEFVANCPTWLCESPRQAWRAVWPEDAMLQLALYCALGLAGLTLLVMLQVLLLGEVARRRSARRQQFNDQWRPFFALCSLGDTLPEPLPVLPRGRQLWFLLQWNRTQLQLRGAARERMNRALVALNMDRRALALLRGRVQRKLIGLTCLRHLADPAHWEAVQPLLMSRNMIVSLAAAQTLIAMDAARAMHLILPAAAARPDWALPRLANLCQQAGEQAVTTPLLITLSSSEDPRRERLIPLLVHGDPRHAAPWARVRLEEDSAPEQLQIALRCLCELGDPRDRPLLLRALRHSHADVRLGALQALHKQARDDDSELFLPLLGDHSWWVRQTAADCLATLPRNTPERLQALLAQVEDRYGQDALRRAIAEVRR